MPRCARLPLAALLAAAALAIPAAAGAHSAPRTVVRHPAPAHKAADQCANADTPSTSGNRADLKIAVVCLINQQRTSRGLPALREDARLDRSAQGWSDQMVAHDDFSHGTDFSARITAAGFDWSAAGENIATGYDTPRQVVDAWMASLGHCQNILNPMFADVGDGYVTKGIMPYGSGPSTWTQDFGLPMGASMPSHDTAPMDGCPYNV